MLIKEICNEAAIQAGDDGMDLYEQDKYLEWANEAAMFLVARTPTFMWRDLVETSSSLVQTATEEDVDPPTDMVRILRFTRDTIEGDLWANPVQFRQIVSITAKYLKATDACPQGCLMDGKLKVLPVGKEENSAVIIHYVRDLGDDIDETWPLAPELDAAAKAYIAGRALSAESDEQAIRAASAKLDEVGALLPIA